MGELISFRMCEAAEMKMDKMKILILLQFMFAAVVSSKDCGYNDGEYDEDCDYQNQNPAPENVRLGVCGQNSMEVLWDHPEVSDDVREYVIESKQRYSEKPVEYEEMLRIDGSETSIVVELPLGRSVKTHIYALTGTGRSKSVDIPDC